MGDSRDFASNVDMAVGTIVWVRRRNGSWWPGRIISDAELSTANLLSPRSGTPVKLLGREDGSVDWYNIEKSKRVKAFRCGDFDNSIEKAKASAGLPTKKREKYARREDAILHALELERQQLEAGYVDNYRFNHLDTGGVPLGGGGGGGNAVGNAGNTAAGNSNLVGNARSRPRPRSSKKRKVTRAASSSMDDDDDDDEESLDSQVYADDDDEDEDDSPSSSGRGSDDYDGNDGNHQRSSRMRVLEDMGYHGRKVGKPLNGTRAGYSTPKKRRSGGSSYFEEEGSALRKRDRRKALETDYPYHQHHHHHHHEDADVEDFLEEESEFMDIVDGTLLENNPTIGMEGMGLEFTTPPSNNGASSTTLLRNTSTEDDYFNIVEQDVKEELIKWENGYSWTPEPLERTLWVEVMVEEVRSSQKETVPMVLLRGKLTRKPVVGYPIVIEAAVDTGFRHGWRTARRTARQRVPRQCPEASNKDDDEDQHATYEDDQDPAGISSTFAKQVVKKEPGTPTSTSTGKGSNKNKKNANNSRYGREGVSSKRVVQQQPSPSVRKTRTLSSMVGNGGNGDEDDPGAFSHDDFEVGATTGATAEDGCHPGASGSGDGEGWPVATCIPVRVALSRIKAAVNGIG